MQRAHTLATALIITFALLCSICSYAQTTVYQYNHPQTDTLHKYRAMVMVGNQLKDEIVFFSRSKSETTVQVFGSNLSQPKATFATQALGPKSMKQFAGSSITNSNTYHLYFTHLMPRHLYVNSVNLHTQEASPEQLLYTIPLNQRYLHSTMHNNQLLLLTAQLNTSVLRLTVIEGNQVLNQHVFNLAQYEAQHFRNAVTGEVSLEQLLRATGLKPVESGQIQSITATAGKAAKLYLFDNTLYLTIDQRRQHTQVIALDLNNHTSQVTEMPYAELPGKQRRNTRRASYLHNGKVFQMHLNFKALDLSVYDLASRELLKRYQYLFNETDSLAFKNGPLRIRHPNIVAETPAARQRGDRTTMHLFEPAPTILVDATPEALLVTVGTLAEVGWGCVEEWVEKYFECQLHPTTLAYMPGKTPQQFRAYRNFYNTQFFNRGPNRLFKYQFIKNNVRYGAYFTVKEQQFTIVAFGPVAL